MFRTKYGEPLMRVIGAYPPGPLLIQALEIYVQTQVDHAVGQAKQEVPEGVCEGLHAGPPKGLVCKACYDAERGVGDLVAVEAEIQAEREQLAKVLKNG